MTHMSDVTNGASLEDCHTNFFALADLSGIKWRRLCADSLLCFDPLEDPVLLSYSKCLSQGILCVWRRVISQKSSLHHQPSLHDTSQLCYGKELWIFWYGEEPDLTGLVSPNLAEAEQGSWESGLSYECRTLLFKALHNLIERCLLSRGFTRLGRFFVEPQCVPDENKKRTQIAFALNFFVHGESTVCASVDARLSTAVYQLSKCHLNAAQEKQSGVKVILSPFGMEGTLTGHGYKNSDTATLSVLSEWHQFYPHPIKNEDSEAESIPAAVEVLIGGIRMKYPSSYVFVVESDHISACGVNVQHSCSSSSNVAASTTTVNQKQGPAYNLLTPPTSPEEVLGQESVGKIRTATQNITFSNNPALYRRTEPTPSVSNTVKLSVNQETCIFNQTETSEDASVMWDFQDPSAVIKCSCSKKNSSTSAEVSSTNSTSTTTAPSTHRIEKSDKKESLYSHIPFHKRNASIESTLNGSMTFSSKTLSNSENAAGVSSVYSSNQMKNFGGSSSLSNNVLGTLPQLHMSLTQPSSVDSHSNIPSVDTSCSQVCSSDPIMPTLSPHPPALKEEDAVRLQETRDSGYAHSPNVDIGHTINIKDKAMSDEGAESTPAGKSIKTETTAEDTKPVTTPTNTTAVSKSMSQIIERPHLPKRCQDDSENTELVMRGLLYDYSSVNSLLEHAPTKKRRIQSLNIVDDSNNEEMYDAIADRKDNISPCTDASAYTPKDPYEFTEFDETSPSERGFRQRVEVFPKEEEKLISPGLPSPPEATSPTVTAAPIPLPAQENSKPPSNEQNVKVPSPSTPRNTGPKFIREEDLTVTLHDLDNIFDTSSSDSDDMFPAPSTPTKPSTTVDEFSGKNKGSGCPTGILELTRMFPTPPSLEQNAAPSPLGLVGATDTTVVDGDMSTRELVDSATGVVNFDTKDPATVWRPVQLKMFVGSAKYAPLPNLPSIVQPFTMPPDCVYKPSWFHHVRNSVNGPVFSPQNVPEQTEERQMTYGTHTRYQNVEDERMYNLAYSLEPFLDPRAVYEMQSPASSISSYLNKHLNSMDCTSASPPLPEASCLLVNLLLSDSLLNIFKDHNFDSCSLCVCNMNIKGSDIGINLPSSLMPLGNDEPQYKCTCGFSAVVHRHRSYCAGLFYEDEFEVTGFYGDDSVLSKYMPTSDASKKSPMGDMKKDLPPGVEQASHHVVDLIRIQCKSLLSSFSLFHKPHMYPENDVPPQLNALEIYDGCEMCFQALETGRNAMDNITNSKMDENLKPSCLHKWPYSSSPLPSTNQEIMLHLDSLKPLLQEAVHKKNMQRMWDVTYVVSGPLTWREFHRLAARGTEDQCEPQPIPSVTVGYDKDCLSLSPFALKFWDKLLLEPYSLPRDIAYIVVAPENDFIISQIKCFFRELSSVYELYKMGRHSPITKVLRDGIMRVGRNAAMKLSDEPVDPWFNQIGDSPIANKLKLYARVCRHRLAPHLSTLSLDKHLLENPAPMKPPDKPFGAASSPMSSSSSDHPDRASTPKPTESASENHSENSGGAGVCSSSITSTQDTSDDEDRQPPALFIYIVEPFSFSSVESSVYRLVTLGLLRCYSEMLNYLPEGIQNSIHLQLLSLDSILCMDKNESNSERTDQLKALAFSVFSQCQRILARQSTVKSLTGFGPAAAQDLFLRNKSDKIFSSLKVYNQPLILASMKDKQTELGEMFGDRREQSGILYCTYCLTEDRRWLLASCTNDKGEFIETSVINITSVNRARRRCFSVKRFGLRKLFDFILEVLASSVHPWRIIIGRLGRLGHGELREWAVLLSRKSLLSYSRQLRDMCKQCSDLGPVDTPSILSACLVSLEPDSALRIMHDQYTPDDRFSSSSCNTCDLSTPEDATCTHILVFPTSATMQSSQATFHQEHIDPLPGGLGDDDLFEALNDDDINAQDINDIFRWTESPTQSPSNSPRRDCISQPGSPGANGRHSPFHHGGPNRGLTVTSESQDEPLQLLQQPLALGYYVSTAKTGPLPRWFWSSCPHVADNLPVFLKSALLIHLPSVHQSSDDILHANTHHHNCHPLDSNYTTDVLRYVLEGYNALSWLSLDPSSHDRRSCLPVHIQLLMQLYRTVENLL